MAWAPPPAADAATVIAGLVRTQSGRPLPGLALLEKGEIHNNRWDRGTLVDPSGRFRIELAEGGQYGLHVYASGYLYKPNAVKVETDKTLEVEVVLVPEPTRANDPVIKRVEFVPSEARRGKATLVRMEVSDPNGDLGPQVLAFNAATGRAFAMAPPRWVDRKSTRLNSSHSQISYAVFCLKKKKKKNKHILHDTNSLHLMPVTARRDRQAH